MRFGIIGGTGLYDWGTGGEEVLVETSYGDVRVDHHRVGRHDVFFVARHGPGHERPPHLVQHKANVRALAAAHVDAALGVFNVGALSPKVPSDTWVLPEDFIQANGSVSTFFDDAAVHVDVSEPFCPSLRAALRDAASAPIHVGGVYASVAGPRFDTRAEAGKLTAQGALVVGMTGGPEATLMREAGLHYAALAFVANAAGKAENAQAVQGRLAKRAPGLRTWVAKAMDHMPRALKCRCSARSRAVPLAGVRSR